MVGGELEKFNETEYDLVSWASFQREHQKTNGRDDRFISRKYDKKPCDSLSNTSSTMHVEMVSEAIHDRKCCVKSKRLIVLYLSFGIRRKSTETAKTYMAHNVSTKMSTISTMSTFDVNHVHLQGRHVSSVVT